MKNQIQYVIYCCWPRIGSLYKNCPRGFQGSVKRCYDFNYKGQWNNLKFMSIQTWVHFVLEIIPIACANAVEVLIQLPGQTLFQHPCAYNYLECRKLKSLLLDLSTLKSQSTKQPNNLDVSAFVILQKMFLINIRII